MHLFGVGSHDFLESLISDILYGCRLGLDPLAPLDKLSQTPSHWLKSARHAAFILDKIIKELRAAILVPSSAQPYYFINFFAVPKKGPDGKMSALRLVRHASYATNDCVSLNDCILECHATIPTMPKLRDYAQLMVNKRWLAMRDLKDAFRQLALHRDEWRYCGYSLFGYWYVDRAVAYGVSSAAAACQRFSELVARIFTTVSIRPRANCRDVSHCIANILAYIDDFVLAAVEPLDLRELERRFDILLRHLGVEQSHHKRTRIAAQGIAYGWHWNLRTQRVSIPKEKLEDMKRHVLFAVYHRALNVRMLKSINGRIMHYSQISGLAKACLWHSTQIVCRLLDDKRYADDDIIYVPISIVRQWCFWYLLLPHISSAPIESLLRNPSPYVYGSSDASSTGAGYVVGPYWAHYLFPDDVQHTWHINHKEMHALLTMVRNIGRTYSGRLIHMYVDSQSVVGAFARRWSSSSHQMSLLWELLLTMHQYRLMLYLEWVPSYMNTAADHLSRQCLDEFHAYIKLYQWTIRPTPCSKPVSYAMTFPLTTPSDSDEFARFKEWMKQAPRDRGPRWWAPMLSNLFHQVPDMNRFD